MNADKLRRSIGQLTEDAISHHVFPGGVVGYFAPGIRPTVLPFGHFTYDESSTSVQTNTVYDIASVTKSIPTSTLMLQALEAGKLSLDDLAITYVPELDNEYRDQITIRHLLTYTVVFDQPHGLSGLVALYGRDFLAYAFKSPVADPPGQRYFYTNPPALIMGLVLERLYEQPLSQLAQSALFEPLGMFDTSFRPHESLFDRIPPSEASDNGEIRGVVHDETARMMAEMGLDTGIAGVFATAEDLLTYGQMLVHGGTWNDRSYLSPETIDRMATNQIGDIGEHTGLGWEINRPDVMGSAAREHVLIKSGHTGCIVVFDLQYQAGLVMLSNRMYPQRGDRTALRAYWSNVNEAFLAHLEDGES